MSTLPRLDIKVDAFLNYLQEGNSTQNIVNEFGPPRSYRITNGQLLWKHSNGRVAARIVMNVSKQEDYVFDWKINGMVRPPTKARINYEGLALENSAARLRMGNPALIRIRKHRVQLYSLTSAPTAPLCDVLDLLSPTFENEQVSGQVNNNPFKWTSCLDGAGDYSEFND
jgi:hypothetical protein